MQTTVPLPQGRSSTLSRTTTRRAANRPRLSDPAGLPNNPRRSRARVCVRVRAEATSGNKDPSGRPFGPGNIRDYDGGFGDKPGARRSGTNATAGNASTGTAAPSTASPSFESLLAELAPEEQRTVRVFRENSPSVVNVSTTSNLVSLFNPFNVQQIPRGVGSGFIWDDKGHVVTNAHVISMAAEVKVTLSDGTTATAKVVNKDREKDIAVLQLEGMTAEQMAALRPVQLGCSSNLLVGQRVLAIGNPFGLDQTLTQGIVSGLGREVGSSPFGRATITNGIQTDAAINPGNSGGPLLDSAGRVVGINTAILDPTGAGVSSGVGFAIPIDAVRGMVEQILRLGRVVRPALGISIAPVPAMAMRQFGSSFPNSSNTDGAGVLVVSVRPGGPADVAGFQGTRREMFGAVTLGDVIVGLNDKPVATQRQLFQVLDSASVGDSVAVKLFSPSTRSTRTVNVVLADRERLAWSE